MHVPGGGQWPNLVAAVQEAYASSVWARVSLRSGRQPPRGPRWSASSRPLRFSHLERSCRLDPSCWAPVPSHRRLQPWWAALIH